MNDQYTAENKKRIEVAKKSMDEIEKARFSPSQYIPFGIKDLFDQEIISGSPLKESVSRAFSQNVAIIKFLNKPNSTNSSNSTK